MAANVPVGDSERNRFVDRIRVIAFREIRDFGVDWISRSWVADHVKSSVSFVKRNWNGNPYDAAMDIAPIGIAGRALSDQSQAFIVEQAMKQKRSVRKVAEILEWEQKKPRSYRTVHREMKFHS